MDIGTWLTRAVFEKTCELLMMNMMKNDEYTARVKIISERFQKLEAYVGTNDAFVVVDGAFNEAVLENDDRFNMRINHLIYQLLGPLSTHIKQTTFDQISLTPTVSNEIANIINDVLIRMNEKVNTKLEIEEKKKAKSTKLEDEEPEKWKERINNLIFKDLDEKITFQIFSSNFNKTLNHVIKPVYKKQEQVYSNILLEIKKAGTTELLNLGSNYENLIKKLELLKPKVNNELEILKILQQAIFNINLMEIKNNKK